MRTTCGLFLAAPLVAAGLSVASAPAAQAQWHRGYDHDYGRGRFYHGHYGYYRGPGFAGPLIGGLAAGAVIGALGAGFAPRPPVVYAPPPVVYAPPPVVYAAPPPPVYAAPPAPYYYPGY